MGQYHLFFVKIPEVLKILVNFALQPYPGVRVRNPYPFRTRTQVRERKEYGVWAKSDVFGTEKRRRRNDFEKPVRVLIFFKKSERERERVRRDPKIMGTETDIEIVISGKKIF